jgi:hypothetical protein
MNRFVVDHTINRTTAGNWPIYGPMLLIFAGGALIFSTVADYTTPLIQRNIAPGQMQLLTQLLTQSSTQVMAGFAGCLIGLLTGLLIDRLTIAKPLAQDPNLISPPIGQPGYPKIGNWVRYCGEGGWTILIVERLLLSQHLWFCLADDQAIWLGRFRGCPPFGARQAVLAWQIALPLTKLSRYRDQLDRLKQLKQRFFHS